MLEFTIRTIRQFNTGLTSKGGEDIWIFGALCLYWCDVELWFLEIQFWERRFLVLISGDSFWERRFLI